MNQDKLITAFGRIGAGVVLLCIASILMAATVWVVRWILGF